MRWRAEYARQALAVSPTEKDAHSELCEATGGTFGDWCVHNHARRIAYYREFVAAHPDYPRGYLWLLDDLIADGRLTEARDYLEKMARVDDSYRVPLYRGKILRAEGRLDEACACWTEMEAGFPDEWLVSLSLGDLAAELQDYDAAERYYRRVLTQQAPAALCRRAGVAGHPPRAAGRHRRGHRCAGGAAGALPHGVELHGGRDGRQRPARHRPPARTIIIIIL